MNSIISQLMKQTPRVLRLGQLHYVRFAQNNTPLHGSHGFFQQKHSFCNVKESSNEIIPEQRIPVYFGSLSSQIRVVKWFSLSTSLMGIIAQPILYKQLCAFDNMALLVVGCSFVGIFTFVTPFLLHFVAKKYVTQLEYNPIKDTYIATTVNFFCMRKKTEFRIDDVRVPDIPGMFTTFLAKDKALFLDARLFQDPSHYARLMGYDKPMDFKLYPSSEKKDT